MYVVAPVPASVQAAIKRHRAAPARRVGEDGAAGRQVGAHAAAGRASRPDGQLGLQRLDWELHDGRRAPMRSDAEMPTATGRTNQTEDFELYSPSRFGKLNRPLYKPEHWDKVQQLDMWTNKDDPVMTCQPLGSRGRARRGASSRRTTTSRSSIGQVDAGGGYGEFRVIPTDGRKHGPRRGVRDHVSWATPSGRWEGDTLVLDSIAFIDTTWLGRGGFFHSDEMHVVEKFTRQGDAHPVRRHGRRPRGAGGAVGVADTDRAAQHESRRGPHPRSAATARRVSRPKRPPRRFGTKTMTYDDR